MSKHLEQFRNILGKHGIRVLLYVPNSGNASFNGPNYQRVMRRLGDIAGVDMSDEAVTNRFIMNIHDEDMLQAMTLVRREEGDDREEISVDLTVNTFVMPEKDNHKEVMDSMYWACDALKQLSRTATPGVLNVTVATYDACNSFMGQPLGEQHDFVLHVGEAVGNDRGLGSFYTGVAPSDIEFTDSILEDLRILLESEEARDKAPMVLDFNGFLELQRNVARGLRYSSRFPETIGHVHHLNVHMARFVRFDFGDKYQELAIHGEAGTFPNGTYFYVDTDVNKTVCLRFDEKNFTFTEQ